MKTFWNNRAGNVSLTVAIDLPLLAGSAAVVTQYSQLLNRRSALQQAADSARWRPLSS
jgi:Flp pilus assembly protein TadG